VVSTIDLVTTVALTGMHKMDFTTDVQLGFRVAVGLGVEDLWPSNFVCDEVSCNPVVIVEATEDQSNTLTVTVRVDTARETPSTMFRRRFITYMGVDFLSRFNFELYKLSLGSRATSVLVTNNPYFVHGGSNAESTSDNSQVLMTALMILVAVSLTTATMALVYAVVALDSPRQIQEIDLYMTREEMEPSQEVARQLSNLHAEAVRTSARESGASLEAEVEMVEMEEGEVTVDTPKTPPPYEAFIKETDPPVYSPSAESTMSTLDSPDVLSFAALVPEMETTNNCSLEETEVTSPQYVDSTLIQRLGGNNLAHDLDHQGISGGVYHAVQNDDEEEAEDGNFDADAYERENS